MTMGARFLPGDPDTILLCRSSQMREAAVALSCFAVSAQPMLLVFDPPPCSAQDYRALHENYRIMRDLRDEALGRKAPRSGKKKAAPAEWSNEEIDRRVELLTPYRRWVKRNRLFGDLAKDIPSLRRAIFLFEARPEDLMLTETTPIGALSDERKPFLPETLQSLSLVAEAGAPGAAFTRQAWRMVRGEAEPFPAATLAAAPDCVSVLAGLYRALREGLPLEIEPGAAGVAAEPPPDATQAVVVEATEEASRLVAVCYALRKNARLSIYPAPDIQEIEHCRARVDARGDADPAPLLDAMAQAVAAVVPPRVVAEVGELPVTAFTLRVPYHFLPAWAKKPIGLMAGDELLLAEIDFFRRTPEDRPHLNLVFDPGYFHPEETDGVLAALKTIPAPPLLLRQFAASNTALISLAAAPIDLIYFNTHGGSDALVLPDLALPGYKLLQRITLRNHPAVFNNACLSWTGVGHEFVQVGARCYVGTLWRVDSAEAAKFAITAVGRMAAGSVAIAAALHDTGADAVTEQAYVFVGPVDARLPRHGDAGAGDRRKSLFDTARLLLFIGMDVANSGPAPDSPLTAPVIQSLRAAADDLCRRIDATWPEPSLDRLALMADELSFARYLPLDAATAEYYSKLAMRGLKMEGALSFAARDALKTKGEFRQMAARLARRMKQREPAINLLRATADELDKVGLCAGSCYLDLADLYSEAGNDDFALESALRAQEAFERPQVSVEDSARALEGAMLAYGRQAQLFRRANQLDKAASAARAGFDAALRAENLKEQASFKMDESRIHMTRGDFSAAVAAAQAGVKAALLARDDTLKVAAFGTLARAQIFAGDFKGARANAIEGRNLAFDRDLLSQIVDFQMDLCDIEWKGQDLPTALGYLREAGDSLARLGDPARIMNALNKAGQLAAKLDSWAALTDLAILSAATTPALDPEKQSALCTEMVKRLLAFCRKGELQASGEGLRALETELRAWMAVRDKASLAPQVEFVADLAQALGDRARGDSQRALATAHRLDALSAEGFHLADFVAQFGKAS